MGALWTVILLILGAVRAKPVTMRGAADLGTGEAVQIDCVVAPAVLEEYQLAVLSQDIRVDSQLPADLLVGHSFDGNDHVIKGVGRQLVIGIRHGELLRRTVGLAQQAGAVDSTLLHGGLGLTSGQEGDRFPGGLKSRAHGRCRGRRRRRSKYS